MRKTFKLKVVLMDDNTEGYFEEGGLRAVRKADEKGNANYEIATREFNTEEERQAYIDGMYDVTYGGWTTYAILNKSEEVHE